MRKLGYIITLLSILGVLSFSANAGLGTKRPPVAVDQGI
jgi:hypothetical protein